MQTTSKFGLSTVDTLEKKAWLLGKFLLTNLGKFPLENLKPYFNTGKGIETKLKITAKGVSWGDNSFSLLTKKSLPYHFVELFLVQDLFQERAYPNVIIAVIRHQELSSPYNHEIFLFRLFDASDARCFQQLYYLLTNRISDLNSAEDHFRSPSRLPLPVQISPKTRGVEFDRNAREDRWGADRTRGSQGRQHPELDQRRIGPKRNCIQLIYENDRDHARDSGSARRTGTWGRHQSHVRRRRSDLEEDLTDRREIKFENDKRRSSPTMRGCMDSSDGRFQGEPDGSTSMALDRSRRAGLKVSTDGSTTMTMNGSRRASSKLSTDKHARYSGNNIRTASSVVQSTNQIVTTGSKASTGSNALETSNFANSDTSPEIWINYDRIEFNDDDCEDGGDDRLPANCGIDSQQSSIVGVVVEDSLDQEEEETRSRAPRKSLSPRSDSVDRHLQSRRPKKVLSFCPSVKMDDDSDERASPTIKTASNEPEVPIRSRHMDDAVGSRHPEDGSSSRNHGDKVLNGSRNSDDGVGLRHSARARHSDDIVRSRHSDDPIRSRHSDDTIRSRFSDDTIRSRHSDDTAGARRSNDDIVQSRHSDYTIRSRHSDGTVRSRHSADTIPSRHSDDTAGTRRLDDIIQSRHADGTIRSRHSDGTVRSRHSDNTIPSRHSDDTTGTRRLDDIVQSRHSVGTIRSRHSDGTIRSRHLDDTIPSRHFDDTAGTRRPDDIIQSRHSAGTIRCRLSDDIIQSRHSDTIVRSRHSDDTDRSQQSSDRIRSQHPVTSRHALDYADQNGFVSNPPHPAEMGMTVSVGRVFVRPRSTNSDSGVELGRSARPEDRRGRSLVGGRSTIVDDAKQIYSTVQISPNRRQRGSDEEIPRDWSREVSRDMSREMSREMSRVQLREKARETMPDISCEMSRTHDTMLVRSRDIPHERSRDMSHERSHDMSHERKRDISHERSRDMSQERSREAPRDKSFESSSNTTKFIGESRTHPTSAVPAPPTVALPHNAAALPPRHSRGRLRSQSMYERYYDAKDPRHSMTMSTKPCPNITTQTFEMDHARSSAIYDRVRSDGTRSFAVISDGGVRPSSTRRPHSLISGKSSQIYADLPTATTRSDLQVEFAPYRTTQPSHILIGGSPRRISPRSEGFEQHRPRRTASVDTDQRLSGSRGRPEQRHARSMQQVNNGHRTAITFTSHDYSL